MIDWLIDCLIEWLIDWLVDNYYYIGWCLLSSQNCRFIPSTFSTRLAGCEFIPELFIGWTCYAKLQMLANFLSKYSSLDGSASNVVRAINVSCSLFVVMFNRYFWSITEIILAHGFIFVKYFLEIFFKNFFKNLFLNFVNNFSNFVQKFFLIFFWFF